VVINNKTETTDYKSQELPTISSSYRLHEKNYLKWSQLVKTTLKGKGKAEHLTDDPPDEKSPTFKKRDEEYSTNSHHVMVMGFND